MKYERREEEGRAGGREEGREGGRTYTSQDLPTAVLIFHTRLVFTKGRTEEARGPVGLQEGREGGKKEEVAS